MKNILAFVICSAIPVLCQPTTSDGRKSAQKNQHEKEQQLRTALQQMRDALNHYGWPVHQEENHDQGWQLRAPIRPKNGVSSSKNLRFRVLSIEESHRTDESDCSLTTSVVFPESGTVSTDEFPSLQVDWSETKMLGEFGDVPDVQSDGSRIVVAPL